MIETHIVTYRQETAAYRGLTVSDDTHVYRHWNSVWRTFQQTSNKKEKKDILITVSKLSVSYTVLTVFKKKSVWRLVGGHFM